MNILALETSTPFLVLGWTDGQEVREAIHHVERAHAEKISHYLTEFNTPRAEMIVVGAGPGSYTGVRVAASYALGLARAWQAQVVRVSTLEAIAANDTYRQLQNTSFPTLYAATNWGDDFAESFANYVHVVLAKRPFEILVEQDGVTQLKYGACWEEARCQEKRKILEAYLR